MKNNGVLKKHRKNFNLREDRITGKSHLKMLMSGTNRAAKITE